MIDCPSRNLPSMRLEVPIQAAVLALTLVTAVLPAQQMTRFFLLPDTSAAAGSDSLFSGQEGAVSYSFDFTEDIRFARGSFVTITKDPVNPFLWNVVDFRIPGTDRQLGSQVVFGRPATPGPYGSWLSSDPTGFPDFSTVNATITGEITATGPLSGVWTPATTLTLSGTIVPGYYHNVILLTGSFSGIGGSISLYMKNDFYPPAVTWEMILQGASSAANPGTGPVAAQGGFTIQRGIPIPNIYSVWNLHVELGAGPPVVISSPPGQNAGLLTFDPGSRGVTGALNVLIDGVPATIPVDGVGDSFTGCSMHPTSLVIDEPLGRGILTGLHFEATGTVLVPPTPPINDFEYGLTTSLAFRGRPGDFYACAATFCPVPGINTVVGDIPVTIDDALWLSLDPLNPYFLNMVGNMPLAGEVLISVAVPNDPALVGATFFLGGATFEPVTLAVRGATNSHRAIIK
jgi:hypothetical protein